MELSYLKFNMSYKGTKYLAECIYLLYNRELSKVNLSKEIYPILGKKYNTNSINIKCNIFQACNNSYFECEQDILEKYFNLPICAKPKTMELIIEIIRHIK